MESLGGGLSRFSLLPPPERDGLQREDHPHYKLFGQLEGDRSITVAKPLDRRPGPVEKAKTEPQHTKSLKLSYCRQGFSSIADLISPWTSSSLS